METARELITGIIAHLDDNDLVKVWDILKLVIENDELEELAFDLMAGHEIANNPECHEYITEEELLKDLGLTEEDLIDE